MHLFVPTEVSSRYAGPSMGIYRVCLLKSIYYLPHELSLEFYERFRVG